VREQGRRKYIEGERTRTRGGAGTGSVERGEKEERGGHDKRVDEFTHLPLLLG